MKINVSGILKSVDSSIEIKGNILHPLINYNEDDIHVNSPIEVDAKVTNSGSNLLINGRIKAELTLKCSRCLESFNYTLEDVFEEELSNVNDCEEVIYFEGDTIDLTDIIINNILLSLPMKALCSEECKGLCPHCGNNLNINECNCTGENLDPRLDSLKKLLKDN